MSVCMSRLLKFSGGGQCSSEKDAVDPSVSPRHPCFLPPSSLLCLPLSPIASGRLAAKKRTHTLESQTPTDRGAHIQCTLHFLTISYMYQFLYNLHARAVCTCTIYMYIVMHTSMYMYMPTEAAHFSLSSSSFPLPFLHPLAGVSLYPHPRGVDVQLRPPLLFLSPSPRSTHPAGRSQGSGQTQHQDTGSLPWMVGCNG